MKNGSKNSSNQGGHDEEALVDDLLLDVLSADPHSLLVIELEDGAKKDDIPKCDIHDGGDTSESLQSASVKLESCANTEALITAKTLKKQKFSHSSDDSDDGYENSPLQFHQSNGGGLQRSHSRTSSDQEDISNIPSSQIIQASRQEILPGRNVRIFSDKDLLLIATGCGTISTFFAYGSTVPQLKGIVRKYGLYVFVFFLVAAGSGACVELISRNRRIRKIMFFSHLFYYSLKEMNETDNTSMEEVS